MLTFRRLDVYRVAIELLTHVIRVIEKIPRGHATTTDQLRRAAMSIVHNIAEGAGRSGPADAARAYGIARGEATEVAAAFDVLAVLDVVSEADATLGMELVERIYAMLTRMCRQG